ncbi:outer membrane beta-barrel family protein [Tenacibaculum agarivorans]|uniref:outer membrane beta-barrel family protein n=1 Tax=Tenacibaculum agarivorans TaxID=1908389 RepID=UPI00094B8DDF|nr:outer membrane beta-barrel family protein [Tenacibaculum agarivorans]
MNTRTLFTTLLILISAFVKAQTLTGTIVSETQEPLPYVNVIVNTQEGNLIKAAITNEQGIFKIQDLSPNTYNLVVSFVGYTTVKKIITITSTSLELPLIQMQLSSEILDNVTIVAQKSIIKVEPDKTVFNVSATIGSTGNNGLEVLRKAPGVRLDNGNNVIVEGKTGVLIYIDGRQSFLQGDDLTSYLQSLQADTIESIEIITQPSARFDAAGNAGIINIILKREKGLGTRGSISSTVTMGDYLRTNNTVSLTSRLKKWNVYGTYSNYLGRSTSFIDLFRIQGNTIFDSKTDSELDGFSNNIRFGADHYLNKKSTIGGVITANLNDTESTSNSRTPIINRTTRVIDSILSAPNSTDNNTTNLGLNFNYRYKDTTGTIFSTDIDYGRYTRDRLNNQPNFYVSPSGEVLNENITLQNTPIHIDIYAAKADYQQNLGKGTFETGVKVSKVRTDNTFDFFNTINGENILNLDRSNQFIYDEKIYAAYTKYNFGIGKWKFQGGLRLETTDSDGDLITKTATNDQSVSQIYTDIFPSAGLTYTANRNNSFALTYSRRIQRPNYQDLNPFEYQINELSFRRGNPFLQPQYTNNLKLAHTYKYTLTTSFSYSYVSDFFAQVTEAIDNTRNFLSTRNVANQEVYNVSVSYPFKVNNWWRVYANIYGSYNRFIATDDAFISTSQKTFGFYAQNTIRLPKDVKIEVSGWFSSPSIWGGTYKTESLGSLNLAAQKSWKQWTGKISVNDVLYTTPWNGTTQFGDLFIDGRGGSDSRNVNFHIRYSFGNSDVKKARKRKGGLEDEKERIGR